MTPWRGLILLWAFWFSSSADPAREDGWVAMPTREACETAREQVRDMAAPASVSACHPMTPEELGRRRREPPADAYRLPLGF
jgi:hypothetical protein